MLHVKNRSSAATTSANNFKSIDETSLQRGAKWPKLVQKAAICVNANDERLLGEACLTTRALPNRSFDAACRHFFRHLREPAELRRNPLVSAYFSQDLKAAARVRADAALAGAIRVAVYRHAELCFQSDRLEDEERAKQRYEIVRADVDGIPRSLLAAKLGLSARQYTRLQHGIRRRVAVLLSAQMQHEMLAKTTPDRACPPLSEVVVLVGRGSTAAALERLSAIMKSGDDSLTASALCLLAMIRQRYMGDFAGANDALAASRSILEKVAASESSRPLINAEIELALIEMDVHRGRFDRATEGSRDCPYPRADQRGRASAEIARPFARGLWPSCHGKA